MTRREFLAASIAAPAARPGPPNVVQIFVDDLGYGDLGVTGNRDVPTPHIDSLARDGIRFTQFYVGAPICSPSRVAVLTGQFPSRHLIHSYLSDRKSNRALGMRDWLDPAAPSIARAFQQAGYATGHFGKWHLGGGRDVGDAPLPSAYGFDAALTSFEGLGDRLLIDGDGLSKQSAALGNGRIEWAPKHRLTEIYLDRALEFIRRSAGKPFYVHLWPCDVHDSHLPRPDLLARFERFAANPYQQRFYAVLDEFDRQMGRLLAALEQSGQAENTIVIFTGDNGPTAWPRYYQEGHAPPGSTGGLRGRKWSLYEGGIRQPLLVRWPAGLPRGRVDETTITGAVDIFPTLCSLCGVRRPAGAGFDGEDMSAAWRGRPRRRRRPLLWEYDRGGNYPRPGLAEDRSPNLAIRDGRWKLLLNSDGSRQELYDFSRSAAERENVAAGHPTVARRLARQALTWRNSLPLLN
jgi:arylsulfatase A-like enzyme